MTPILVVPGWTGSGPDHWQTHLEAAHPHARRVHQRDWDAPDRDAWVPTLAREVAAHRGPPVLVAHSLGSDPRAGAGLPHGRHLLCKPPAPRRGRVSGGRMDTSARAER